MKQRASRNQTLVCKQDEIIQPHRDAGQASSRYNYQTQQTKRQAVSIKKLLPIFGAIILAMAIGNTAIAEATSEDIAKWRVEAEQGKVTNEQVGVAHGLDHVAPEALLAS